MRILLRQASFLRAGRSLNGGRHFSATAFFDVTRRGCVRPDATNLTTGSKHGHAAQLPDSDLAVARFVHRPDGAGIVPNRGMPFAREQRSGHAVFFFVRRIANPSYRRRIRAQPNSMRSGHPMINAPHTPIAIAPKRTETTQSTYLPYIAIYGDLRSS